MIVKVQRALAGTPPLLVYDKPVESLADGMIIDTHTVFSQIPATAQMISALLGEDTKGYFGAELVESVDGK